MSGAASLSQAYFAGLQAALAKAGICEPVLLIDKTRLNQNIDTLKGFLPRGMAYRIVAKSLPSEQLLVHVAKRARTDRLMSFNVAMVAQLLARLPDYDQLLGKPVPVAALAQMLGGLKPSQKKALSNVQWLVDTPERASQYGALARAQKLPLRINLEIDVGLHRGGMAPGEGLQAALDEIVNTPELSLSGLMGYEPHVAKMPEAGGLRDRVLHSAWDRFGEARALAGCSEGAAMVQPGAPRKSSRRTVISASSSAAQGARGAWRVQSAGSGSQRSSIRKVMTSRPFFVTPKRTPPRGYSALRAAT